MTRQKAPWSFAAVDIEVPSSGTREVLLTRASGDWTGWTVDGVTAPASVTDELTVTAPSSLLGRRWRLLDPDGRERIVGCVVAAKAGSASEDLTVDVSTGATIVEVTIAGGGGGGGGAVDSVNGETGVVVLDAGDVGAVPVARTITAGTGLTGGGDLSADRTLTVSFGATAGTAAEGNDARLTNARTPTAHAASHQDGGSDELALDGSQITTGTVGAARLPRITPTVYTGSSAPWVATAVGTATGNGGLNVAYRMAFLPIELTARPWDRCGVTTTAAGAGTSWEMAVYDLLSNGEPGAQIASFGTLDMSLTAGDQDLTISFTPSSTRWFYIGIKVTAFGSVPTVRVAGATGPAPRLPGWPHRRNGDTFAGLGVVSGLAAGPLPAVAPTVGNAAGQAIYSTSLPIVYMRAA